MKIRQFKICSIILLFFFACLSSNLLYAQSLKEAINLTKNEEFDFADKAFQSLLASNPSNSDDYFYRGENFFKWGKLDSARVYFEKGIKANDKDPLNYAGLGNLQYAMGDKQNASANFDKAKKLSRLKDAHVLCIIAKTYIFIGTTDLNNAFALLHLAMADNDKYPDVYIELGDAYRIQSPLDGSKAVQQYEKALTIDPKNLTALLRLGKLWEDAQQYDTSFSYFQKAIKYDSTFAPAYREEAEMYLHANHYQQAINRYQIYLRLNNSLSARFRYAEGLFLANKCKEAIPEMKSVLSKDSGYVILYRLLAYSQFETKDYNNGVKNMSKFLAKAKRANIKLLASDYSYYGRLLAKTGHDSLALKILKTAVSMKPETGTVGINKGELFSQMGQIAFQDTNYAAAVQYFHQRILLPQPTPNDFYFLGRAYFANKQYKQADSAFAVVNHSSPDYLQAYIYRAEANIQMDSTLKTAKPIYELIVKKIGTDTAKYRFPLIEAYSQLAYYNYIHNDMDSATIYYKKVQAIDPSNSQARAYFDAIKKEKAYEEGLKKRHK